MAAFTVNVNIIRNAVEEAFRNLSQRNPLFTSHMEWHLLGDGGEHEGHLLSVVRTATDGDPPEFWLDMPGTRIEYRIILITPWRDNRERPARADRDGTDAPPSQPDGH